MTPLPLELRNTILIGDVRARLAELPAESVHCVVTSPPYWGLRDYKAEGQIGLEATPEEFIENMVCVGREIRRVLRKDGTLWLNIGDCYATGAGKVGTQPGGGAQGERWKGNRGDRPGSPKHSDGAVGPMTQPNRLPQEGLKPKDLVGQPWMLAFALRADGWYLRSDVIWSKPNPMPESVTDRPTKAHEYVFLLTKSERYFYDAEAIREPSSSGPSDVKKMIEGKERIGGLTKESADPLHAVSSLTNVGQRRAVGTPDGRNRRSVWSVPTAPFPEAHFATFPPALVEPCIQAGTSEWGCCPECGAPWKRIIMVDDHAGVLGESYHPHLDDQHRGQHGVPSADKAPIKRTTGWAPTCTHEAPPVPCIVLDPFMGSGTTALVAAKAGRDYLGIELNPDYVAMSERRLLPYRGRLL